MNRTPGPFHSGAAGIFTAIALMVPASCLDPPGRAAGAANPSPLNESGREGTDGRSLVLWDGAHIKPRSIGTGRAARFDFWDGGGGWASCDGKPNCRATLSAIRRAGVDGAKGLKLHAEGAGWIGGGWSWFAWYPPTAGTDLTSYGSLSFQIRVEDVSASGAPDKVSVALVGSSKKGSAFLALRSYDEHFDDGRWHRITIPLADFASGPQAEGFDPRTVCEFQVSTWSGASRAFDIDVDQIVAEK